MNDENPPLVKRWTGRVQEITARSWRLQGNYRLFWSNSGNMPWIDKETTERCHTCNRLELETPWFLPSSSILRSFCIFDSCMKPPRKWPKHRLEMDMPPPNGWQCGHHGGLFRVKLKTRIRIQKRKLNIVSFCGFCHGAKVKWFH